MKTRVMACGVVLAGALLACGHSESAVEGGSPTEVASRNLDIPTHSNPEIEAIWQLVRKAHVLRVNNLVNNAESSARVLDAPEKRGNPRARVVLDVFKKEIRRTPRFPSAVEGTDSYSLTFDGRLHHIFEAYFI